MVSFYSELETPSIAGVFSVLKSNLEGHLMKWATQRIPGAIEGCLQIRTIGDKADDEDDDDEVETINNDLILAKCDTRDPGLNWEFSKVDTGKYLLRKLPNGPCVGALRQASGEISQIYSLPCNENDVDQVWRICENLEYKKCDI